MPELPEVETIRRNLEQTVVGARVLSVSDPTHERTLRNQQGGITELRTGLVGARLGAAVRRGKFLWFSLSGEVPSSEGPLALVIHLGMSGQLRVESRGATLHRKEAATSPQVAPQYSRETRLLLHERLRFTLDNEKDLVFCDQRTFGHVELRPLQPTADGAPGGMGAPEPLLPLGVEHIARDVLDPCRDTTDFVKKLAPAHEQSKPSYWTRALFPVSETFTQMKAYLLPEYIPLLPVGRSAIGNCENC